MTPIRALFFLAAVSAACAGRIPAKVQETTSLESHIALLASGHVHAGNPIEDAIEKIEALVRKIRERIQQAESELADALEASTLTVVKKINDFIIKRTGVDLKLDEKWEAQEKKTEQCTADFQTNVKDIIVEIKSEATTCAATQIAEGKEITEKVIALVNILRVVPVEAIQKVRACGAVPTTVAPTTESPETEAPVTVTDATLSPADDDSEDDNTDPLADDTADRDYNTEDSEDSENTNAVQSRRGLSSWIDMWKKAKCVTGELAKAAKEFAAVPELVARIASDAADMASKHSRQAVEACAVNSISGKETVLQTAAAQFAYCIIAPSKQQ